MNFDWTTLTLEVVNFLILVWILKRLFYQPVMDMIARRRAAIEKTLTDAHAIEHDANEIKARYEGRMSEWEQERAAARAKLAEELAAERRRQLARLEQTIETEREKNRAAEAQRQSEQTRAAETAAIANATRFAARLLERVANADLDMRIAELVAQDLAKLPNARKQALIEAARAPDARLEIVAARELTADVRRRLADAVASVAGVAPPASARVDPAVLGGVRLLLGSWILEATIADELAFFRAGERSGV